MNIMTQRASTRNAYRAPIHFSEYRAVDGSEDFHEGEMINSSTGGMAFFTVRKLVPGEGIVIKLVNFVPDPYWPEARQDYVAEVRWCVKEEGEQAAGYHVGVRFLVESCRMCDKTILCRSADAEDLCCECFARLDAVCDGSVKECIAKYLMGNVV